MLLLLMLARVYTIRLMQTFCFTFNTKNQLWFKIIIYNNAFYYIYFRGGKNVYTNLFFLFCASVVNC